MKVKLKKSIFISRWNVTFPKDVELNTYILQGVVMVEHPTRKGLYCQPKSKHIIYL